MAADPQAAVIAAEFFGADFWKGFVGTTLGGLIAAAAGGLVTWIYTKHHASVERVTSFNVAHTFLVGHLITLLNLKTQMIAPQAKAMTALAADIDAGTNEVTISEALLINQFSPTDFGPDISTIARYSGRDTSVVILMQKAKESMATFFAIAAGRNAIIDEAVRIRDDNDKFVSFLGAPNANGVADYRLRHVSAHQLQQCDQSLFFINLSIKSLNRLAKTALNHKEYRQTLDFEIDDEIKSAMPPEDFLPNWNIERLTPKDRPSKAQGRKSEPDPKASA